MLPAALDQAIDVLAPGGRCAVLVVPLGRGPHRQGPPAPAATGGWRGPPDLPPPDDARPDAPPAQGRRLDRRRRRAGRQPPRRQRPPPRRREARRPGRSHHPGRPPMSTVLAPAPEPPARSAAPALRPSPRPARPGRPPSDRRPERRPSRPSAASTSGSSAPRSARRRLTPKAGVLLTAVVFATLFAVAGAHTIIAQGQIRLDGLDQQVRAEQARYQQLRKDVAQMESPGADRRRRPGRRAWSPRRTSSTSSPTPRPTPAGTPAMAPPPRRDGAAPPPPARGTP